MAVTITVTSTTAAVIASHRGMAGPLMMLKVITQAKMVSTYLTHAVANTSRLKFRNVPIRVIGFLLSGVLKTFQEWPPGRLQVPIHVKEEKTWDLWDTNSKK
jgi:hypothetical protein